MTQAEEYFYTSGNVAHLKDAVRRCMNNPGASAKYLSKALAFMSVQRCSAADEQTQIGDGSSAKVVIMKHDRKTVVYSNVKGKESLRVVYKISTLDMNLNELRLNKEGVLRLPDPMSEIVFTTMVTTLYDKGVTPFVPRLMSAFSCNDGRRITMVYDQAQMSLGDVIYGIGPGRKASDAYRRKLNVNLPNAMIQVCHALYCIKKYYSLAHLDLHALNVLMTRMPDSPNAVGRFYFRNRDMSRKKYWMINVEDVTSTVAVYVLLPIWNTYKVHVNDFGYACRYDDQKMATSHKNLRQTYGGADALKSVLADRAVANTVDLCFLLTDLYRWATTNRLAPSSSDGMIDAISRACFGYTTAEMFENNPDLNNPDRQRNVGVSKNSYFNSHRYLLGAMARLCTVKMNDVKVIDDHRGIERRAQVRYVLDESNHDMVNHLPGLKLFTPEFCEFLNSSVETSSDVAMEDHIESRTSYTAAEGTVHDPSRTSLTPFDGPVLIRGSNGFAVSTVVLRREAIYDSKRDVYGDGEPIPEFKDGLDVENIKLVIFEFDNMSDFIYEFNTFNQSVSEDMVLRFTVGTYNDDGRVVGGIRSSESGEATFKHPPWIFSNMCCLSMRQYGGNSFGWYNLSDPKTIGLVNNKNAVSVVCGPRLSDRRGNDVTPHSSSWNLPGASFYGGRVTPNNVMTKRIVLCSRSNGGFAIIVIADDDGSPGLSRYHVADILSRRVERYTNCLEVSCGERSIAQFRNPETRLITNTSAVGVHIPRVYNMAIYSR